MITSAPQQWAIRPGQANAAFEVGDPSYPHTIVPSRSVYSDPVTVSTYLLTMTVDTSSAPVPDDTPGLGPDTA